MRSGEFNEREMCVVIMFTRLTESRSQYPALYKYLSVSVRGSGHNPGGSKLLDYDVR